MIPEWLKGKTIAVWDLETDPIPATQIYCNSVSIIKDGVVLSPAEVYTQYWTPYSNGSLMQSMSIINQCDYYSGHNIVTFDIPVVAKLLGIKIKAKPLDTLIISKLIFSKDELYRIDETIGIDSDLYGRYSLKAFGQRMGDFKLDFNDFSALTEDMTIYCNQDVDLTAKLLIFLLNKPNFPSKEVIELEHKAATIIQEQTDAGFYIDIEHLKELNSNLLKEKGELAREIATMFSPKFLKDGKVKKYKKLSKSRKYLPNSDYIPLLGT